MIGFGLRVFKNWKISLIAQNFEQITIGWIFEYHKNTLFHSKPPLFR